MNDIYLNSFHESIKKDTVLYLEDSNTSNHTIARYLNKIFKKVLLTQNTNEAFELFLHNKINIVVVDIYMPITDRIDMIKKLKELSPNLPRVVVIDEKNLTKTLQSLEIGNSHIVLKPIDIEVLLKEIKKVYKKPTTFTKMLYTH